MSVHRLIVGKTLSGKSALAKQLGSELRLNGAVVIAFNPTKEKGYTVKDDYGCIAADFETYNPDVFMNMVLSERLKHANPIFLIIDEAHEFFTRAGCQNLWLGTRGRHHGFNIIAITQRGQAINPTFRSQVGDTYIFNTSVKDAKFIADDIGINYKDILDLDVGEFYHIRFKEIEKYSLFSLPSDKNNLL